MKRFVFSGLFAAGLLSATAAFAHPELVKTSPAQNATGAAPAKIEMRFSERLVDKFSGADVLMTDMPGMKMDKPSKEAATASVSQDGMTLIVTPAKPLPPGTYRVEYHVAAEDTHRVTGSFTFIVK